jgi:hypothetical protein
MYVDVAYIRQKRKSYKRVLLRENYRERGKVKHRTIANLSRCSEQEIQAIKLALRHKGDLFRLESLKGRVKSKQGRSVGAILLLKVLSDRLHLTKALGNSVMGRLALWQVMARVIEQGSRLSAVRLAGSHAVCDLLNLDSFNEDDLYENLDWLYQNQEKIEKQLFDMRYEGREVPRLFLYDVTSSYLEGTKNELGDWGYPRDGKRGKKQIVIGLLTDGEGDPVSVEIFQGNTKDNKTLLNQVKKLAGRFGIEEVTLVGDRGMIKSTQIEELKEEHFYYITAITKPQIETLMKKGIIQLELFSEDLWEVESDGIRYILRRNPIRAEEIEKTRREKIEKVQRAVVRQNEYLSGHKRAQVTAANRKVEKLLERLKLTGFTKVEACQRRILLKVDEDRKEELAILDGCYVIKTGLNKGDVSAETVHQRYKDLALVEPRIPHYKDRLIGDKAYLCEKRKKDQGTCICSYACLPNSARTSEVMG